MLRVDDILYRWSVNDIARICKVHVTTARSWKRGAKAPPDSALMLLARDLGCFHADWTGWTINDRGELCSPENWISTPGAIRSLELLQRTLGEYRRENRVLKAEIQQFLAERDRFTDQPIPADWEKLVIK